MDKMHNLKRCLQPPAKSRAIRSIPKSSKGHFVGELVFERAGHAQRLGFASHLEKNAALCLIYCTGLVDIEEQLAGLPFTLPSGQPSTHHFDYRITLQGGRSICISVKPEHFAVTYEYRSTIALVTKAAVGNICDDVKTITERNIHPIKLHNAKLFHSARHPEPPLDQVVNEELKKVGNPTTIDDFLGRIGLSGHGFRSVARAIHSDQARLFAPEKIRGTTLITRGSAR